MTDDLTPEESPPTQESWDAAVKRLDKRYARVARITHTTAVIVLLILAFCLALLKHTNANSEQTRVSLCTFRLDLEQRVTATVDFLADHPDGVLGLTAAQIKMGIDNQRRTIQALQNLQCDDVVLPPLLSPTPLASNKIPTSTPTP